MLVNKKKLEHIVNVALLFDKTYHCVPDMQSRSKVRQHHFKKTCGCLLHDEQHGNSTLRSLHASNNIRRAPVQELLRRGLITERTQYICARCFAEGNKLILSNTRQSYSERQQACDDERDNACEYACNTSSLDDFDPDSDTIEDVSCNECDMDVDPDCDCDCTSNLDSWAELSKTQREQYISDAHRLGQLIFEDLYSDSEKVLQDYKHCEKNQRDWLSERNPLLIAFLSGRTCVKVYSNCEISKKFNSLVHGVEQILHARNSNTISPFAFHRNLIVYAETRSELACQLTGAWEPAGGYTSVSNFFMQPREPAVVPSSNVNITIDNNQKVARSSGRVREGSSVPVSVYTAVSYIKQDIVEDPIMSNEGLKPGNWLQPPDETIISKVNEQEKYLNVFRQKRQEYISELLIDVYSQQKTNDYLYDYVDTSLLHDNMKVCNKCNSVLLDSKSGNCPICKCSFVSHDSDCDSYKSASNQQRCKSTLTIGEPVMVNPCSKDSVRTVLH